MYFFFIQLLSGIIWSLVPPWWAPNESGIQLAWPSDQNNLHINGLSSQHWYRALCNFSEVPSQPNLLQTWIAGEAAKIVDQLDDEEVIYL